VVDGQKKKEQARTAREVPRGTATDVVLVEQTETGRQRWAWTGRALTVVVVALWLMWKMANWTAEKHAK
jgi:hypothetical protein